MASNVTAAKRAFYIMNRTFLRYCLADSFRKGPAGSSGELIRVAANIREPLGKVGSTQALGFLLDRAAQCQDKFPKMRTGTPEQLVKLNSSLLTQLKAGIGGSAAGSILFSMSAVSRQMDFLYWPTLGLTVVASAILLRSVCLGWATERALELYNFIISLNIKEHNLHGEQSNCDKCSEAPTCPIKPKS